MLVKYEDRVNVPESVEDSVRLLGAAAAISIESPKNSGIKATYIGTGIVDLTWLDDPGVFIGLVATFSATAPAAVKGYTLTYGDFNYATRTLRLNINNSLFALADLAAAQRVFIKAQFSRSGLT